MKHCHTLRDTIRFKSALVILALFFASFTATAAQAEHDETTAVVPGMTFRDIVRDEGPFAIQVLGLDRSEKSLDIGVVIGSNHVLGIEPLDSIITRIAAGGRRIAGGINGDFYILAEGPFQGDPIGLCVADRELVSTPVGRSALVFTEDGGIMIDRFGFDASVTRADGASFRLRGVNQFCPADAVVLLTPRFGEATRPEENAIVLLAGPFDEPLAAEGKYEVTAIEKRSGDAVIAIPPHRVVLVGKGKGAAFLDAIDPGGTVTCSLALDPSPGAILHAVGGGPRLMRGGGISIEAGAEGISEAFVDTRHPRTAFGYNDSTCFLVTVDGRREGYSAGMNLYELADLMKELGAAEAINLDGGGSTTMWVDGTIRNRPSDNRIRPIANGILVYTVRK